MKKVILISVIAMSILVARDCRYEEQELNILIRQYEDLQDDYDIAMSEVSSINLNNALRLPSGDPYQELIDGQRRSNQVKNKYNVRFNRLNKRINQQKQRLNNCRNGK